MRQRKCAIALSLAVAWSQTACGSDDDPGGGGAGTASENNVKVAELCMAKGACGGDPIGTWELLTACVTPPADGFDCANGLATAHGKASGTLTIGSSSFSMMLDTDISQCGDVDSGSDRAGGSVLISGSSLTLGVRQLEFCVDGNTLWLNDAAAVYPELQVLGFLRAE
jgi:hypothetical protein